MKKKSSRIGNVFTHLVNVRAWSDYDRTKSFSSYILNGLKRLFVPQEQETTESFEDAMKRMNLTEHDIESKQKSLFRMSLTMIGFAVAVFLYLLFQLFFGSIKAVVVSLVVILIALVLAFRYHFWYYQIKTRTLGCTVQQWYRQGLMGEKE